MSLKNWQAALLRLLRQSETRCRKIVGALFVSLLSALAHGASWHQTDAPVFESGDIAAVKGLIAAEGSYPNEHVVDGFLHAARSGNVDLVKYLEKRGWLKACRKAESCRFMDYAAHSHKPAMVRYALSLGFKPTRSALRTVSTFHLIDFLQDDFRSIAILCEHGADPSERGDEGKRPTLIQELENISYSPVSETLLLDARKVAARAVVTGFFKNGECRKGAQASKDFDNYLAIVESMGRGSIAADFPAVLKPRYFRPEIETYLLYEALASGNFATLKLLKSLGWIANCKNQPHCQLMDVAAETGAKREILKFILDEGFALDSLNASGGTPLTYATLHARADAAKFLCEYGADYRKPVRLHDRDRSIMSILRREYGTTWCQAIVSGGYGNKIIEEARTDCEVNGEWVSAGYFPECIPGGPCRTIPFPPPVSRQDVQKLKAYAEIFAYFRSGLCSSPQQTPTCTAKLTSNADVIGDKLNLRAEPNSAAVVYGVLPFSTEVEVLDGTRGCELLSGWPGRWVKVKVRSGNLTQSENKSPRGLEGWVFDKYLDFFPGDDHR